MSVLTATGASLPAPSLPYTYPRSPSSSSSRPSPSSPTVATQPPAPGIYTRPQRKSVIFLAHGQTAPKQAVSAARHSRTPSSSTTASGSAPSAPPPYPGARPANPAPSLAAVAAASHARRSSTAKTMSMQRQGTTASAASLPRRSTSGRSVATESPTSYVALMRKQKATVWCDRAQAIDSRLAAAQKAAKHRAALEVQGITSSARTNTLSSGGVVGKIRHGGVPRAPGYVPANMSGASVPVRLSANEMLGDEEEGQSLGDNSMTHARTGSGRSSTNSTRYRSGYPRPDPGRFSSNSSPPSGEASPARRIPEDAEAASDADPRRDQSDELDRSTGDHSEDSFGELRDLAGPSAVHQAMEHAKQTEDLRRRGSVDERTMSMGQPNVRLFVANPDVED